MATINFSPKSYTTPAPNGTDAPKAGTGFKGNDGTYYYDRVSGRYNCSIGPSNGGSGGNGDTGGNGADGAKGLAGPICPWYITDIIGNLVITAGGGNGQDGGNGGKGGDGGDGGPPGILNPNGLNIGSACNPGYPGPQGKGGKGGRGGAGGDGGPGAQVIIYYTALSGGVQTNIIGGKPGNPGKGGKPGSSASGDFGPGADGGTAAAGSPSNITLLPNY